MTTAHYKYIVNNKVKQIHGGNAKEIIDYIGYFSKEKNSRNTKIEFYWGDKKQYRGSLKTIGKELKPDLKLIITLKERKQRTMFMKFLEYCKSIDINKDEDFFKLIQTGAELFNLTDINMSTLFGVPRPTVTKWRTEQACPRLPFRNIALRHFKRMAKERINETIEGKRKKEREKKVRPEVKYDEIFFEGREWLDKL